MPILRTVWKFIKFCAVNNIKESAYINKRNTPFTRFAQKLFKPHKKFIEIIGVKRLIFFFSFAIINRHRCGSIAQLGEHLPYKQGVTGSSPVVPTTFGTIAKR